MNAGAAEALGELALNTAKLLVLNTATFGGYGAYQTGSAIWAGYQEDGIPGALNAVNPFYQFLRAGLDTYAAVAAGDHRAIGAHGLTTLVLGAAAVVGIANGVAALAEAAAARGAAATQGGLQVQQGGPTSPDKSQAEARGARQLLTRHGPLRSQGRPVDAPVPPADQRSTLRLGAVRHATGTSTTIRRGPNASSRLT
jgi:hypothetical protein